MAKPDTDDGWLKYAHELDAALAVADFTKGARIVLREVFSQVFGPAKLRSAAISPTEIGALVGVAKSNVARATKELADANVLVRLADGSYRFNKNYESWVSWGRKGQEKGLPLLSPVEVSFCRSAPARSLAFRAARGSDPAPETTLPDVIQPDNPSADSALSNGITLVATVIQPDNAGVIQPDNKSLSRGITNGAPHPISGDCKTVVVVEGAGGGSRPVIEPTDTRPARPVKPDPAEVERCVAWAETVADPFEEISSKVRTFATSYPLDWIEAAVLCGVSAGAHGGVWAYAHKCLRVWWSRGAPDHAEIAAARADPSPASPRGVPAARDALTPSQRRREDWKAELAAVKAERLASRPLGATDGGR